MQSGLSDMYRARDVPLFLCCRLFSTAAMQVQSVAVGWRIYEITHNPLSLGLVGLCQFVPMFALTLPAGAIALGCARFDLRVTVDRRHGYPPVVSDEIVTGRAPGQVRYQVTANADVTHATPTACRETAHAITIPVRAAG